MKEFTYFHDDELQKAYIQPIMSFCKDDMVSFCINLLSERGLVKIRNFKWLPPTIEDISSGNFNDNSDYNEKREVLDFDLTRQCEVEILKNKCSDITNFIQKNEFLEQTKTLLKQNFSIERILFDDVGHYIFKFYLKAFSPGYLKRPELGIRIKIMNPNEAIVNEAKKNFLIFDKSNEIQVRIGDTIVFYFTVNKQTNEK